MPIGNLGDLSIRGKEIIPTADLIVCEIVDTFVDMCVELNIPIKADLIQQATSSVDEVTQKIINHLSENKVVLLASEAGYPTIADPGARLFDAILSAGFDLEIIGGPSIPTTALSVSGIENYNDNFVFQTFMNREIDSKKTYLSMLSKLPHSIVFIDKKSDLMETLKLALDILGDRSMALCLDITTDRSMVIRGDISTIILRLEDLTEYSLATTVISGNVSYYA